MHSILFVTATQGYITIAIKEKLEEAGYQVVVADAKIDDINHVKEDLSAVLLYVDENMVKMKMGNGKMNVSIP